MLAVLFIVVAEGAWTVNIPSSEFTSVNFAAAPVGDWEKADIAGAAGGITIVATMDAKVADYPAASVHDGYTGRVHAFATLQEGIDALATNDNRDWLSI